jgi:hypothetical protein
VGGGGRGEYVSWSTAGEEEEGGGGGEGKSLCVRLIGMGPEIPGHSFRADINVNFVLKP